MSNATKTAGQIHFETFGPKGMKWEMFNPVAWERRAAHALVVADLEASAADASGKSLGEMAFEAAQIARAKDFDADKGAVFVCPRWKDMGAQTRLSWERKAAPAVAAPAAPKATPSAAKAIACSAWCRRCGGPCCDGSGFCGEC